MCYFIIMVMVSPGRHLTVKFGFLTRFVFNENVK